MNNMVERVGAALKRVIEETEGGYPALARAAIEAMREPTEAMRYGGYEGLGTEASRFAQPEHVWYAMIDAALGTPNHRLSE